MIEFGGTIAHIVMSGLLIGVGFIWGKTTIKFNVESEEDKEARLKKEEFERLDKEETEALNKQALKEFNKLD